MWNSKLLNSLLQEETEIWQEILFLEQGIRESECWEGEMLEKLETLRFLLTEVRSKIKELG